MLLLFTFSVTPKKWLHDAFANHDDVNVTYGKINSVEQLNNGIVCKCEDLFSQTVFTVAEHNLLSVTRPPIASECEARVENILSHSVIFIELRGPPAASTLA